MMCDRSTRLISRAIEGHVGPSELDTLMSHLERCALCRVEAETQVTVKRLLASRPDEALPDGLTLRLTARLHDPQSGAPRQIDWRTWTVRLLPAAAVAILVAGVVGHVLRESLSIARSVDLPTAVACLGHGEVRALQAPAGVELTDRAYLWASLMEAIPSYGKAEGKKGERKEEVR